MLRDLGNIKVSRELSAISIWILVSGDNMFRIPCFHSVCRESLD